MKLVIFGLAVSSAWGNGHATLWRGLIRALSRRGHRVIFFERDVPYYASHRDLDRLEAPAELVLYRNWEEVLPWAKRHLDAEVAMITSYCHDGQEAAQVVLESRAELKVFYDLDTPVTLSHVRAGNAVPYLPRDGLGGFDLVLSYTGGAALDALRAELGARHTAALYGSVDPRVHRPVPAADRFRADVSYLGTYSADRQEMLEKLLFAPAQRSPGRSFVVAGSQYPEGMMWPDNIRVLPHVAPEEHATFYCSAPISLSVTRAPMTAMGYCPSGRLFEAAACGVPVLSDRWPGLDEFFEPGCEILVADNAEEVLRVLDLPRETLARIGKRARERTLAEHTAERRAEELIRILEERLEEEQIRLGAPGARWAS